MISMQSVTRRLVPSFTRSYGGMRTFSASGSAEEHMKQISLWRVLTFVGITVCAGLGTYTFTHEHGHHEKPPPYHYLRIRNKAFPWGDCGLLEKDCPSEEG